MMRCEVDSEYTFYQKKIDYKELGYLSFEFSDGLEFYVVLIIHKKLSCLMRVTEEE